MAYCSHLHRIRGIRRKVNAISERGACPYLRSRAARDTDLANHWQITPGFSLIHMDVFRALKPGHNPGDLRGRYAETPVSASFIGWRFSERAELSIADQNFLRPVHAVFGDAFELDRTLVVRSAVGKLT